MEIKQSSLLVLFCINNLISQLLLLGVFLFCFLEEEIIMSQITGYINIKVCDIPFSFYAWQSQLYY